MRNLIIILALITISIPSLRAQEGKNPGNPTPIGQKSQKADRKKTDEQKEAQAKLNEAALEKAKEEIEALKTQLEQHKKDLDELNKTKQTNTELKNEINNLTKQVADEKIKIENFEQKLEEATQALQKEINSPENINRRDNLKAMEIIEEIRKLKFKYNVFSEVFTDEGFEKAIIPFMGEENKGILGVYTSGRKRLYMRRYADNPLKYWVLRIHETVHALQDQNFDLEALHDKASGNQDVQKALTGLIEGEAVAVMMRSSDAYPNLFAKDPKQLDWQKKMLSDSPRLASMTGEQEAQYRKAAFNYRYGANFVFELLKKNNNNWDIINKAYTEKLPLSTEQILHPEKYISYEKPVNVKLPILLNELGEDWKITNNSVSGEFGVMTYLLRYEKSRPQAVKAAEGWGGDKYHTYYLPKNKQFLSVWNTTWDTEKDSLEFYNATKLLFEEMYPEAQVMVKDKPELLKTYNGDYVYKMKNGNLILLRMRIKNVLILEEVPEKLINPILTKIDKE